MNDQAGAVISQERERFAFAQIPLVMAKDPMLKRPDIAVTMFVLPWIRETGWGWTTVKRIADGACMCERSVLYSLKRLEKAGWFYIETSKIGNTRREFLALWLTDEGFETLAIRLGVVKRGDHSPALLYVPPNASMGVQDRAGPILEVHELPTQFSFTAQLQSQFNPKGIALMDACNHAAQSPEAKEVARIQSLIRLFSETSRDFAAVSRGLDGLLLPGVAQKVRDGAVDALARIVIRLLKDHHSKRWHRLILEEIAEGGLLPRVYLDTLTVTLALPRERAEDPANGSRGAMFHSILDARRDRRTDADFADEIAWQRGLELPVAQEAATG